MRTSTRPGEVSSPGSNLIPVLGDLELDAAIRAIAAHRWWGVPEDVLRAQVLLDRPDRLFQLVRIVDEEERAPGLLRDTPEDLFVGACRLGRAGTNRQGFGR